MTAVATYPNTKVTRPNMSYNSMLDVPIFRKDASMLSIFVPDTEGTYI